MPPRKEKKYIAHWHLAFFCQKVLCEKSNKCRNLLFVKVQFEFRWLWESGTLFFIFAEEIMSLGRNFTEKFSAQIFTSLSWTSMTDDVGIYHSVLFSLSVFAVKIQWAYHTNAKLVQLVHCSMRKRTVHTRWYDKISLFPQISLPLKCPPSLGKSVVPKSM